MMTTRNKITRRLAVITVLLFFSFTNGFTEKYTSKFDSIDIDEILNNERLLKNYMNCLMERGPCTTEGSDLKRILPEALELDCAKCTDIQKEKANKVIMYLAKNKKPMWKELEEKYDTDGKYRIKYREKYGVDLENI
ncbi:hypothetical protein GWI33_022723 [Rhynchophorus ferrugineus]|uniref:Chemosensory protein n=1 Tax=Rhynchophorus ferrugineus TaxID=354439 RepID=A0A834MIS5_RHYFE|nr:hypothetical protein GWI33_022723 [Rhynchophorus ferrugineus]